MKMLSSFTFVFAAKEKELMILGHQKIPTVENKALYPLWKEVLPNLLSPRAKQ